MSPRLLAPFCACVLLAVAAAAQTAAPPADPAADAPSAAAPAAEPAQTNAAPAAAPEAAPAAAPGDEPQRATMMKRLAATGKTGLVQLAISIVALAFALERLFNLRRSRVVPTGFSAEARQLWAAGRFDELTKHCERSDSTLARVVKGLVAHRTRSAADLNAYASDVAGREIRLHHLRAYPMVVAATLETLLGLFGTVGGMVGAFEAVALAGKMGDPSIMAEDISYALMTTAVGLVIAVPSLAAYHYFRARTSVLALSLEEELTELIADWFLKEDATRAH